jgi:hypothetical protein
MKRTILVGALVSLALLPAFAQDASSDFDSPAATAAADTGAAGAFSWGSLKYSGDQEFAWRFGAYDPADRTGGSMDSKMAAEYKLDGLKVVAAGQVKENEFVPGETAAFYTLGPVKFGLGYQEFSWGVADKKNPTDTLNARDYRFSPNADRLVNPAASVAVYPADWVSLEAVYEPWKEQSKYPTDFAAGLRAGFAAQKSSMVATLGPNVTTLAGVSASGAAAVNAALSSYSVNVTTETSPVNTYNNPVYGGRANFFLPGVDLSFSYLYDRDTFYTPVVTMTSTAVPLTVLTGQASQAGTTVNIYLPSKVDLVYKRIHRFGLDAKTTIDRYGLWVEAAYNKTEASSNDAYDNRHDNLDWTVGGDFNFGPGSAYYMNLQYAGTYVLGYDASTVKDYNNVTPTLTSLDYMTKATYRSMTQMLGSQSEQLMNTLTGNIKFPLADATVTPSFSGAVIVPYTYDDTTTTRIASAYLNPEVDWAPVDGVHVFFGAELAYGWVKNSGSSDVSLNTTTDKMGLYTTDNNVYLKVKYSWNGNLGAQ